MIVLADEFETAEIEAALDDLQDLLERRRSEGRNEQAYEVALLLLADRVCEDNEPVIN